MDWSQNQTKTVGVFGKLPSHPDFIRINAGGAGARAWDEWVSAGLEAARRAWAGGWEERFDQSSPLCFTAHPTEDPAEAMVGYCRPGGDRSGRRYPFSVFAEVKLDKNGRGTLALPFAALHFLEESASLTQGDAAGASDSAEVARLQAHLIPTTESSRLLPDLMKRTTMQDFWESVVGDFSAPRKHLLVKNLFGVLAPLRGYEPLRLSMGLRLPGSQAARLSPTITMTIWGLLCRAVVGEAAMSSAALFWHGPGAVEHPSCYLFFHMPSPILFPALLSPDGNCDQIWDLETMGQDKEAEAAHALGPAITGVLDSPHYGILDFIQRI